MNFYPLRMTVLGVTLYARPRRGAQLFLSGFTSARLAMPPELAVIILAGEPGTLSVKEFSEMNRADYERAGRLIREAGIKGEGS